MNGGRSPTSQSQRGDQHRVRLCDGLAAWRVRRGGAHLVRRTAGFLLALLVGLVPCCGVGQEPTGLDAAVALERALVDVIARCERSVVAVARARKGISASKLTDPTFVPNEFGTGVIVDQRGLVLTNLHVLGDPEVNEYAVWSKRRPFRATVKATDPWSDLAVLEIEGDGLTPITFGKADDLRKGQIVIALGNPYGIARDGEVSASWGIVSNLLRKAPRLPDPNRPSGRRPTVHHYGTLIQTDVRLHLGASGGALVNLRGEMVGLTTSLAARAGYEKSVGYAIPVNDAFRRAVETLKEGREVEYGLLGVVPGSGSRDVAYDQRRAGKFGVKVYQVFAGTPAAESRLRDNDVITHIQDRPVYDADDLIRRIGSLPVGEEVKLTVVRSSFPATRTFFTTVKLAKKAPAADRMPWVTTGVTWWRGLRVDHATAVPGFASRQYIGQLDPDGCVAVVDVRRDSPAFQAALTRGTFISHVSGRRVSHPADFYNAVADTDGDVELRVSTEKDGYQVRVVPAESTP
jgi:serine protease Do